MISLQQTLSFAWHSLGRDWRCGDLSILASALIIAVASVSAVGLFTDRVRLALEYKSNELLGADLVIRSSEPIAPSFAAYAEQQGLQTAAILDFRSVVLADEKTALAEVKAVNETYPLRGTLTISPQVTTVGIPTDTIPAPGTVWVEARLLTELQIAIGDEIEVGARRFPVAQLVIDEPDRGGDFFALAPRVLLNIADIPSTELVQPGSRVEYRVLIAGDSQAIANYRQWAVKQLAPHERLLDVRDARPEIRAALERAQQFLGLAASISVLLAGIATALGARRFAQRHYDAVAIMRCFGASSALIGRVFILELVGLAVIAGFVGLFVGVVAQQGLSYLLGNWVGSGALPLPSWQPLLPAWLTGVIMLMGFGLPPLLTARRVTPLRVLRRDIQPPTRHLVLQYSPAILATFCILIWQSGELRLAFYISGGVIVTALALSSAAWLVIHLLKPLRQRIGVAWRFGFVSLVRRPLTSAIQMTALGIGILVLLVLSLVRHDLLNSWQARLPDNAPNHFLINVQPDDADAVRTFLAERGLEARLFPMIRGRLAGLNDRPLYASDYQNPRAQGLLEREFNLSWSDVPQIGNQIVAGYWWPTGTKNQLIASVEKGVADTFNIRLGDHLQFFIAGQSLEATVVNIRQVEWDSFQVNFFVVFPVGVLDDYPATWITSLYVPPDRKAILTELVKQYPSISAIDVATILNKVREIMDRVILAVEYVFLFTLLAGLVVLWAAFTSTQDERLLETAVLRTLGASKTVIIKSLLAEYSVLGLLAGLLAALGAMGLGYLLAVAVFDLTYQFNGWLIIIGMSGGLVGVSSVGLWAGQTILRQPPLIRLREG